MRALTKKSQKREESSQRRREAAALGPSFASGIWDAHAKKRVLMQGEQSNILAPCPLDASLLDQSWSLGL